MSNTLARPSIIYKLIDNFQIIDDFYFVGYVVCVIKFPFLVKINSFKVKRNLKLQRLN